jgi:DHA2 family multidrug resistance protein
VSGLRLWVGFLAMCLGLFMAVLDVQVVASSLTAIGTSLKIDPERLGWIQTGYLMAEVIAIPLTGLLTRAFTLQGMFAAATAGFTLASVGCAFSSTLPMMVALRVAQGFCGGMLIPAVFTSVFVMMPQAHRVFATTLAGVFAVAAPTVGPLVGGYLTEHFTWNWIFLVNVVPGLLVSLLVAFCVRVGPADRSALRRLDYGTLVMASLFLAALELLLNEAPGRDWRGTFVFSIAAITALSGAGVIWRALSHASPFIDLRRFRRRDFALGCLLSFVLGLGLYGSVFMLALFLGLVRGHGPLAIGEIMMVSGAAQLATAPLAAWLETRMDNRVLAAVGFALFGGGLLLNGFTTPQSDFQALFWPQVLRGLAVMFCLLPATRLALESWPETEIADASGLFNLMRNLGGAIGIALVDTMLQVRTKDHAAALASRLKAGDPDAARLVGLPTALFHHHAMGPIDLGTAAMIAPMVRRAALTQSFNEAWLLFAWLFGLSLLALPLMRRDARSL